MIVTALIACDLLNATNNLVEAVRGDRNARAVACRLLEDGLPWVAPESARVRVAYTLPDGTPGLYDELPDGSPAGAISGSTVTIPLPEQILAFAGCSDISVMLLSESGDQLSTFPFRVRVSGGSDLQNPATYPILGAEFEGKILFGGPGGKVVPLAVGPGLEVAGGVLRLKISGGGEGVVVTTDAEGILRVYLDGVEVPMEIDADGYAYWPGLTASVGADGYLMLERS